jgi:ATP-dependent DNA helicase RecQ
MDACRKVASDRFQKDLRPVQTRSLELLMDGNDTFVLVKTGGGKTLIGAVAGVVKGGVTLMISPLKSLIHDQTSVFEKHNISHCVLNSDSSVPHFQQPLFVLATPETVVAHRDGPLFQAWQQRKAVSVIVIDEAHCVWTWGSTFRGAYMQCGFLRPMFPNAVFLLLSATATQGTIRRVSKTLQLQQIATVRGDLRRHNLHLSFVPRRHNDPCHEESMTQVLNVIHALPKPGMVFGLTQQYAEDMAAFLRTKGLAAAEYHAGLPDDQRLKVQESWLANDCDVVCCTVAFGMGVDKPNVRFIIHGQVPSSLEQYAQEVGRAGRDGHDSHCITFWDAKDDDKITGLWRQSNTNEMRTDLDKMMYYAEATEGCRHRELVNSFGQQDTSLCKTSCDLCQSDGTKRRLIQPVDVRPFVEAIQRILPELRACSKAKRDVLRGLIRCTNKSVKITSIAGSSAVIEIMHRRWDKVRDRVARLIWAAGIVQEVGIEKTVYWHDAQHATFVGDASLHMVSPCHVQRTSKKRVLEDSE